MNVYLTSDVLLWQALLLTAVSGLVGVLGGFVGLALGTMRLPALLLMGIPGQAPPASMVSSLSALGSIRREGRVNFRIVLIMGIPAFAGASSAGSGGAVGLVFWQSWAVSACPL